MFALDRTFLSFCARDAKRSGHTWAPPGDASPSPAPPQLPLLLTDQAPALGLLGCSLDRWLSNLLESRNYKGMLLKCTM